MGRPGIPRKKIHTKLNFDADPGKLATVRLPKISYVSKEEVTRKVKRWHSGDQALRWTATGLLEAERKFRRVKGYRELEDLHRRLNVNCSCQRCQLHRAKNSSLTQQEQGPNVHRIESRHFQLNRGQFLR
jgi:hypothetical protein